MNHGYPPPRVLGGPQVGPTQRLNELLDNVRTEFETESQRSADFEGQSKSLFRCLEWERFG
jgi:glucose repression regulatory protein TUP1